MTSKPSAKHGAGWTPSSSSVSQSGYFSRAVEDRTRALQEPTARRLQEGKESTSLQAWFAEGTVLKNWALRHDEWIAERLRFAAMMLRDSVTIDAQIRGGVPVLRGTRVPVAQILGEIAGDARVSEIADDLDLDMEVVVKVLEGMAIHLDRPFFRW